MITASKFADSVLHLQATVGFEHHLLTCIARRGRPRRHQLVDQELYLANIVTIGGIIGAPAHGSVYTQGNLRLTIDVVRVTGSLSEMRGAGVWKSPTCNGTWTANRAADTTECKGRSNNASLKRPIGSVAPE